MFPLVVNVFITFLKWNSTLLTFSFLKGFTAPFLALETKEHVCAEHGKGRPMMAETCFLSKLRCHHFLVKSSILPQGS